MKEKKEEEEEKKNFGKRAYRLSIPLKPSTRKIKSRSRFGKRNSLSKDQSKWKRIRSPLTRFSRRCFSSRSFRLLHFDPNVSPSRVGAHRIN